jgi:cytochrome c553
MKAGAITALISVLVFASWMTQAAGDAEQGRQKSQTCAACHGPDGNSTNPVWPNLAGQHASYIVNQLKAFQNGERKNPQMSPMAAALSEADMTDLAAYYASQIARIGAADPEAIDIAEKLYRAGNPTTGTPACMACHGPNGAGNPAAGYPALRGQHAEYTMAQLRAYRSGDRSSDAGGVMRAIASRLSEQEIIAVAKYLSGLH